MVELTKEEAVVVRKIIAACHSMPCCIDEFASLTAEEAGYEDDDGNEPDDCPLWSLEKKLKDA